MNKKYFINFANNGFYESQKFSLDKAKDFGFITNGYNMSDIDTDFFDKNKKIFSLSRGSGYWLWKPYIILKKLKEINDGDYLIYMDSGAFLCKDPQENLNKIDDKGILSFSLIHKQSTWCKKDLFEFIFPNENDYSNQPQILASYVFIRKCVASIRFIEEWLDICQNYNLMTDEPSVSTNYTDFREHRHDQAIYSLLVYKNQIKVVPDISQWCSDFGIDSESRIIEHHRGRK
jgi:hypothetical protein